MEEILLDTMFDIPSNSTVSKVVVDSSAVRGDSQPMLIFDNNSVEERKQASGS